MREVFNSFSWEIEPSLNLYPNPPLGSCCIWLSLILAEVSKITLCLRGWHSSVESHWAVKIRFSEKSSAVGLDWIKSRQQIPRRQEGLRGNFRSPSLLLPSFLTPRSPKGLLHRPRDSNHNTKLYHIWVSTVSRTLRQELHNLVSSKPVIYMSISRWDLWGSKNLFPQSSLLISAGARVWIEREIPPLRSPSLFPEFSSLLSFHMTEKK